MMTNQVAIMERPVEAPPNCGKCHTCGTALLVGHITRDGKKVDWCPGCQASRVYESHGWKGLFIETTACKESVCTSPQTNPST